MPAALVITGRPAGPLSVCALSSVGHAHDIPGREITARLPAAAAELDGGPDVHADSAITMANATPRTPHDRGLAVTFPADPMLAVIDASLPAGNGGVAVIYLHHLLYNL